MGYRIGERKPKEPRRTVQGAASPSKVYMQNGATLDFAIPCWYIEAERPRPAHHHSRMHHDHVGWPAPDHPDHSCQDWDFAHSCCSFDDGKRRKDICRRYLDMGLVTPIHLSEEGYDAISIAFADAPSGLTAHGSIDAEEDWVIRVLFSAKVEEAVKDRVEVPYTIFAKGTVLGKEACDVVASGNLVVLPGPYA